MEITQLLQGYIQNEVDLNEDGTCRETCTEYSYTKSHSCYQNLWCRQQKKCEGRVINCQYIDADMWICPAVSFSFNIKSQLIPFVIICNRARLVENVTNM